MTKSELEAKFDKFLADYNNKFLYLKEIFIVKNRRIGSNGKDLWNSFIRNKPHFIRSIINQAYTKKVVNFFLVVVLMFMKTKPTRLGIEISRFTSFIFSFVKRSTFNINRLTL